MRPRRLLNLSAVMLGLAWVGVTLFAPPKLSTRLRRYVSAPLRDGSRYTLLYPERLHPEPKPDGSLLLTRSFSLRELLSLLWASGARLPYTQCETISVCRTPYDRERGAGRREVAIRRNRRDPFRQFEVVSSDDRADRCDRLLYKWHQSQYPLCAPVTLDLMGSFQVLRPGESPPPDPAEDEDASEDAGP